MEEDSFTALRLVRNEINTSTETNNNSLFTPEKVLTTSSDMDKLSFELFKILLPTTMLFTLLNCVGVPGNLFVFLVYLLKFKTSATRVFVLTMAMCDFLVNLSALPVNLVYYRHMYTISSPAFCTITYLVQRIPVYVSCIVLVCASLDRRHRVCQPLRPQLDARQATFIMVVPLSLTAIATFPFVAFYTGMQFTTTTYVTVRKCGFQTEFPGDFVKVAEGMVLAVYCIVGLTLLVGAYSHILYRVKQQNKRLSQNITCVAYQLQAGMSMMSTISCRRLGEEVEQTTNGNVESRDEESYAVRQEGGAREQMAEDSSLSAIRRHPARRGAIVSLRLASKTTLIMFVLIITTIVCLTPYIIWTGFPEPFYEPDLNFWVMNLSVTCVYLPTLRSTITPFIYFYFNPKFRLHCRQVLHFEMFRYD